MAGNASQIQYLSFRYYLNETLLERCRRNSRYSLRSFARDLSISPSTLSRILSGKREINREIYERCRLKLKISPLQRSWFEAYFEKRTHEKLPLAERRDYRTLTSTEAKLVGGWECIAILNLLKVRDFQPSASWIADKLDIPVTKVKRLVSTMIRLGFLKVESDGHWRAVHENVHFSPTFEVTRIKKKPSEANEDGDRGDGHPRARQKIHGHHHLSAGEFRRTKSD